jgi:ribosomal protein L37AE/L43A
MVQPQDRAAARAARENAGQPDPFGQLDQAIAQHEDGSQLGLEFEGDERVMPLVRDIALNVIESQIKGIQVFAAMRGETLLFENLCCERCGSKDVIRQLEDNHWFWECGNCKKPVSDIPAIQQMTRLFKELRAFSSNLPSQDFEKGLEIFSVEDINSLTENFRTVSSDEHASARVKATLKRLLDIGTIRPYVVPNPAWRGQLDELREHFPNFVNAVDEADLVAFLDVEIHASASELL